MIWTTVSSQSCFCWLYRASPSLVAKNIISLISVLTIWWCPCLESSLVLLEEGVCYDQCVLLAKLLACSALFCTPRPNLPVTQVISWLPTFAFQIPIMKRISFLGVSSRRSCRSSENCPPSASSALLVGAETWITVILNSLPWKWTEIILSFLRLHPITAFWTLLLTMMAIPFLLRNSCLW